MKKTVLSAAMSAILLTASANVNDRVSFNGGWLFELQPTGTTVVDRQAADTDDSSWRSLDLPHDWAVEGDFSEDNPCGTSGGALPGGTGWYRKHFPTPADLGEGGRVFVDFDGVYMNSTVYVNGKKAGERPYGYSSFSCDITPFLSPTGDNVIAVKVDNSQQPNSRWYSGCGIYRNVWLRTTSGVFMPLWGMHAVPVVGADGNGIVDVATDVENTGNKKRDVTVVTTLLAPDGSVAAKKETTVAVNPGSVATASQQLEVGVPKLWSPKSPALYTVRTELLSDGKRQGIYESKTGFRTLKFDASEGFSINGERMKIRGVCLHHDAGALGAVVNRRAIERQLQILKEMGANAVRTSHNPPAPELLDVCDSLGIMVMDEAFDMWRKKKNKYDYGCYFNEWHERDLSDFVRRDRNHPSVIIWSIGNEIYEQWIHADADTLSLDEANRLLRLDDVIARNDTSMSINSLLTAKLAGIVRDLDQTRPVTAGCNEPSPVSHLFRSGALDLIGYNYFEKWYKKVPENFPGKPFIITESVSALMTRGYYRMPSDSLFVWPTYPTFSDPSFACSSYGNCHVPWGTTHEHSMADTENNDFICGQFVWTGFDYLGEPTPYGWPARSSYFGIVDLAGFPKDVYYMYQSHWRDDIDVLHLFPHWNWEPGREVEVMAYYNNADEVELFVNGRTQGVRPREQGSCRAVWRVVSEPGMIEAVSRRNGREVARRQVRTAGPAAAIRLSADRPEVRTDGDLCYITVDIVDADGNLCPLAENEVTFAVDGPGVNVGVDNGSPISLERFKADRRKAFYGKALLIVKSSDTPGAITVSATSPGLKSDKIEVISK